MVSKYLSVMRILYCYIGSLDAQDLKWKQLITGLSIVQASNEGFVLIGRYTISNQSLSSNIFNKYLLRS